ncbi:hypothetical protein Cob_v001994 [Colletotrichum orbiculare MAFF 240422]|uniref:Uncharacterized protein n=2 Tax=Colletotrichum orbiculare species complex TaxID=2707354 RepID=A0A484G6Z0_COLOR|nr:hypothetical protein Cob_v001994 [Colletotrichum orbiculare MAFF 240422]
MQFSYIVVLLVSAVTVQSTTVGDPALRALAKLVPRQGQTPESCYNAGQKWCQTRGPKGTACPKGCLCNGGNLPKGGCCACTGGN